MRKTLALVSGGLALVAAVASCGGGGGGSGSGAQDAAFTKLYDRGKNARVRVTYESHGSDGSVQSTWTVSQDGDKRAYIEQDSKWVVVGNTAYTCSDLSTPTPSCEEIPGGPDGVNSLIAGFAGAFTGFGQALATEAGALGFSKKSTDTIAGRRAECREVTVGGAVKGLAKAFVNATGAGGIGWSACIDKETGVALRVKILGDKNDKSELVAVKVEQPNGTDFATPTTTSTTEPSDSTNTVAPATDTTDTTDATDTTVPSSDITTGDTIETTTSY